MRRLIVVACLGMLVGCGSGDVTGPTAEVKAPPVVAAAPAPEAVPAAVPEAVKGDPTTEVTFDKKTGEVCAINRGDVVRPYYINSYPVRENGESNVQDMQAQGTVQPGDSVCGVVPDTSCFHQIDVDSHFTPLGQIAPGRLWHARVSQGEKCKVPTPEPTPTPQPSPSPSPSPTPTPTPSPSPSPTPPPATCASASAVYEGPSQVDISPSGDATELAWVNGNVTPGPYKLSHKTGLSTVFWISPGNYKVVLLKGPGSQYLVLTNVTFGQLVLSPFLNHKGNRQDFSHASKLVCR